AQHDKQHDHDKQNTLAQIVQDRASRVVDQVAAIQVRHDLHARRQDALVELLHLGVNPQESRLRFGAFTQQNNALHHVVIIHRVTVLIYDGLAEPAKPDFWSLRHDTKIANANRRPILRFENCVAGILSSVHQADGANIESLRTVLDKTAAGIDI